MWGFLTVEHHNASDEFKNMDRHYHEIDISNNGLFQLHKKNVCLLHIGVQRKYAKDIAMSYREFIIQFMSVLCRGVYYVNVTF